MRQHSPPRLPGSRSQQRGYALLLMLVLVTMGILFTVVSQLSVGGMKYARAQGTSASLLQAKEALIGYAATYGDTHSGQVFGYLPCPDMTGDGSADALDPDCGGTDGKVVIGLLPYKQLGLDSDQDSDGNCLWYAVSGTFKASTNKPTPMNWDTHGQIEVTDANNNVITQPGDPNGGAAAVIFSVGPPISSQSRLAGTTSAPCGISSPTTPKASASYANYIDVDPVGIDTARSQPFPSAPNVTIRVTQGVSGSSVNNDQILAITPIEIFSRIIRRSDFASQVSNLLNDGIFQAHLKSISIADSKGTKYVICANTSPSNTTFCNNWKEMLLLTQLPTTPPTPPPLCNPVLIFAGQKTGAQVRNSATDKSNPANYLEAPNLTAFNVPTANSASFVGSSPFDWNNPSADLVRCLP